jgi:hypothetical protein
MKLMVVGLGLLVSASTLAVPERAIAGVHVDVGIALGRPIYVADHGYRSRDAGRYGYERGQREGTEQGYEDGRKGRRFDFVRDGDYRDADDGYKGWMGSRREYANAFQRGFAEGYRRAFDLGRRDRRNSDDRRHGYDDDRDGRDRRDRGRW